MRQEVCGRVASWADREAEQSPFARGGLEVVNDSVDTVFQEILSEVDQKA